MKWQDNLDESEKIQALFEYKGVNHKVIGSTNKRNFFYKKLLNEEKFVSSQKAISHLEYGEWKVPWYAWFWLIIDFISSLGNLIDSPTILSIVSFIPVVILIGLAILFRKFEYLISAVGSENFHIISRKKKVLDEIITFIKQLHHHEQVGLNASEEYVRGNYYDRLIKWILFFLTFEVSFFLALAFELQIFFRDYFAGILVSP